MSQRFFVDSPIDAGAAHVTLAGDEAHHLSRVMRARTGDLVTLFDGSGTECSARITRVDQHAVQLVVLSRHLINRELARHITLAVALPKGERQRWLVEKAVELGVAELVPLITARGVAPPTRKTRQRFERRVREASKQCGRNRLMRIAEPRAIAELLDDKQWDVRLIAQPLADPLPRQQRIEGSIAAAVGPEGGFTEEETAMAAAAGWTSVGLGARTLRVETAALALAAQLAALAEAR